MQKWQLLPVITLSASLVASLFFLTPARADELAKIGRQIAEKNQQAVVSVEIVLKTRISYGGEENTEESKNTIQGIVVDPSGLVVTSQAATDPSSIMDSSMPSPDDADSLKHTTEIISTKIILADGKEIPAQIVLRDKDLDLAFLRPLTPVDSPLPAIDLTQNGTPELFDQVIMLQRMGALANRTIGVSLDRIHAIIEKPRRFYIVTNIDDLCMPAFTEDGKIIGIVVMRQSLKTGGNNSMSEFRDNILPVIVTAADVLSTAKQAPEVKKK